MHLHRSGSWTRRTVMAALVVTAAAGCASSESGEEPSATSSEPSVEASAEPSAETSETPAAEAAQTAAAPIEGTWSTSRLTPRDFRAALTEQGLGDHADAFVSELGRQVELTLEVEAGFWTLSASMDGAAAAVTDRGTYELEDARIRVLPYAGGENVFRWSVEDDELALALVSTTEQPYEGVPAETYQRGWYTTSAFARDAS